MKYFGLIVALLVVASACTDDTLVESEDGWMFNETVFRVQADADMNAARDMVMPDLSRPDMARPDMGSEPDLGDPDMPVSCLFEPADPKGSCDLVAQNCAPDKFCTIYFRPSDMSLIPGCSELVGAGTGAEGGACTGTECSPGLYCANWRSPNPQGQTCSKICSMRGSLGCDGDEVCVSVYSALDAYGFCAPTCDPYDPNSCPAGQRCSPDTAALQEQVCEAKFRCMEYADGGPDYIGACSLVRPDQSGCGQDWICYETFIPRAPDGSCQKPCQSDADCVGLGTEVCSEPHGIWGLRSCRAQF